MKTYPDRQTISRISMLMICASALVSLTAFAQPEQAAPGSRFPPGTTQVAQSDSAPATDSAPAGPTIDLTTLIDRLGAEMGREFILDSRVPREVRAGSTAIEDADYDTFLALLRVNGMIAISANDDQIMILSETAMRWSATRVLQDDDRNVSDHEVVARVIDVPENFEYESLDSEGNRRLVAGAAALVPVLRPMAGQNAHLAATPGTNKLILVDRYDNVRRLTEVIEELTE
jgi:general secretion pathway protein D